jgi:hypothetical protein
MGRNMPASGEIFFPLAKRITRENYSASKGIENQKAKNR